MPNMLTFDAVASRPKHALALIYDLEGFSRFFNQPDVQEYVPHFLNTVNRALYISIFGGKQFWEQNAEINPLSLQPAHQKFLGDGELCVWVDQPKQRITSGFVISLCNRLWNIQNSFADIVKTTYDRVPVIDLPRNIRFGVARGTVYELRQKGSRNREYIGVCLNLASRLGRYCPDLRFIASARIGLPGATLKKNGYMRVIAKSIPGFPQEIVIVDKDQYNELPAETREQYFSNG